MTHTCKVCGVTSDVAEFYNTVNTRCKECHKEKVRRNRAQNVDYYRTYDAHRYQNDPKVKARHRRYAESAPGKASSNAARKRWQEKNEEKRAAHIILNNALKNGRAVKPSSCQVCSATDCRIEGHHHDYAKPLDVIWLCKSCHVAEHRKENANLLGRRQKALSFDATPKPRGRHSRPF